MLGAPKAADIWKDNELDPTLQSNPIMTFGTNTRAVYVMLLHNQWKVDVVCEEDLVDDPEYMAQFKLLYLTNAHIPANASAAIAKWANTGGKYSTADAATCWTLPRRS